MIIVLDDLVVFRAVLGYGYNASNSIRGVLENRADISD